jgi:hypothetical protein
LRQLAAVPEIIDPVFAKTSQNARFLLSENERFGLVFVKTGSINSGTGVHAARVSWQQKKNYNQEQMKKAADSRQLEAGAEKEGSW